MGQRDPLADPERAIRRVYAYAAYRLGRGADAEDVTSTVIERALRYRSSYDPRRGDAMSWLIAIARTCVDDELRARGRQETAPEDAIAPGEVEADTVGRIAVAEAVATLEARDRELVALRYGADLSVQEIAKLLGLTTNAVNVALHRSRTRLRDALERAGYRRRDPDVLLRTPATRPSP